MKINLRFFASVRELVGTGQEVLEVAAPLTVGEVRTLLIARGGNWEYALAQGRALRMAHNQVMCDADTVIGEGDEVAFFPPVTGG
ncbi:MULTISPECIES: molybdopterin converting factor subunit 1 [Janthinobacterium]|jgi:molybdopterin synthase sulfur carrier subunit|uniref:molybdopterin converting factor subunit 1 n=1 Tax=Janthinobacterium TaxID=29580 RepID=UPI000C2C99A6|nr:MULTISPECIES: molybdopterin converting factor subunit 1 [Janthinobacterium]MDI3296256.1 molybdopterin converting factor subunit 1 [Janthinobacterium tructae]PKB20211.1 molybdopterin synthase subunit MoaD [Janthinobacterium sp. 64]